MDHPNHTTYHSFSFILSLHTKTEQDDERILAFAAPPCRVVERLFSVSQEFGFVANGDDDPFGCRHGPFTNAQTAR